MPYFPPDSPLPVNRTDTTAQLANHAADHNALAGAINDMAANLAGWPVRQWLSVAGDWTTVGSGRVIVPLAVSGGDPDLLEPSPSGVTRVKLGGLYYVTYGAWMDLPIQTAWIRLRRGPGPGGEQLGGASFSVGGFAMVPFAAGEQCHVEYEGPAGIAAHDFQMTFTDMRRVRVGGKP
jgi:hypothetical protein